MSSIEHFSLIPGKLAFYRKSESDSICLCCFQTVVANRYMSLEQAEEIHRDTCLMVRLGPVLQHAHFWK